MAHVSTNDGVRLYFEEAGEGPPVLFVHEFGGDHRSWEPQLRALSRRYRCIVFSARGYPPSDVPQDEAAYSQARAVEDIVAVLDGLGWDTAYLMGHSWGGHLVFHAAVEIPERLEGVLSVDPLGAVGDGGMEAFSAEMTARVRKEDRARARELDDKDIAGEATPEESREAFSLFWPSYFADPASAPPLPRVEFCSPAMQGLFGDLTECLPKLEKSLPSIDVPFGVLVGELSPMPPTAGTDSAARIPGAWAHVQPGAGHFVWHESPGCLVAPMDRLVAESPADP